jgi:hypothetical protein
MLDNPGRRSEMSEERATEILAFIEGSTDTNFGNIQTEVSLGHLVKMAYNSLGLTIPGKGNLGKMIANASERLGKKRKRLGLDISDDRATHLADSLFEGKKDPHFRAKDTLSIKRALIRKALAQVASLKEDRTGEDHSDMMQAGEYILKEKYPLQTDGTIN